MPIDKPEATAATSTRRTFLGRAAIGSAMVAGAGTLLGSTPAGAQAPTGTEPLEDAPYLVMADQLHSAAVIVYVSVDTDGFSDQAIEAVEAFRADHQTVVDALGKLKGAAASKVATVPDPTVLSTRDDLGGDEASVLRSLATLENRLSATHLRAVGALEDAVTARSASQVVASSAQRATYLGLLAGVDPTSLAPTSVDDAEAIEAAFAAAEASLAGEAPAAAEPPETSAPETGDDEDLHQNDGLVPEGEN